MALGILGKKVAMTRVFDESGTIRPVTVVQAGPCPVLAQRTPEADGYAAIQIAFEQVDPAKLKKPQRGMFQVLGTDAYKHLSEFRMDGLELPEVGTVLTVADFAAGSTVDVRGRTKGHGFAGVMKRHGFKGGRDAHGSNFHRAPGSIGTATTPGRTFKGRKMPGQYGNVYRTIRGLKIVDVVPDENLLLIGGSVPGARGALLWIEQA